MSHSASLNLARYDLLSIRLAVTCAQQGSLSGAARVCNLALAAASRRLRELEEAVGGPLFERHARGMIVTAAGRAFVKHGLAVLQSVDRMGAELHDLHQGIARHVALCASTAAISQFLPPLLARFAASSPQIRVDLEEQVSETVAARLREGRADVGIFVEGPDASGLATQLFRMDELVLVLPRGHALAAHATKPARFEDLLDEDWISLHTGAAMLQRQQQAAVAANRPLKLRFQVRSFDAVCHLVQSGLGVAILPKAAATPIARAMKLVMRPLADEWAQRRLLLAVRAEKHDPAVRALVDFLAEPSQNAKAPRRKRQ